MKFSYEKKIIIMFFCFWADQKLIKNMQKTIFNPNIDDLVFDQIEATEIAFSSWFDFRSLQFQMINYFKVSKKNNKEIKLSASFCLAYSYQVNVCSIAQQFMQSWRRLSCFVLSLAILTAFQSKEVLPGKIDLWTFEAFLNHTIRSQALTLESGMC